jgi:hypothetical protein
MNENPNRWKSGMSRAEELASILRYHAHEGRVFDHSNGTVVVTRDLLIDAASEIDRLTRKPTQEVLEAAVNSMAHVNEHATGIKFTDLLRRMAIVAIGIYQSSAKKTGAR